MNESLKTLTVRDAVHVVLVAILVRSGGCRGPPRVRVVRQHLLSCLEVGQGRVVVVGLRHGGAGRGPGGHPASAVREVAGGAGARHRVDHAGGRRGQHEGRLLVGRLEASSGTRRQTLSTLQLRALPA